MQNEKGDFLKLPESVDLETLIRKIPDTTNSMSSSGTKALYTFFYHIDTTLKGNVPCSIDTIDIDDMVVFRTV